MLHWARSEGIAAGPGAYVFWPGGPIRKESVKSGRHAIGPELAEKLEGSKRARTRMRVVLETIAGKKRVLEACQELGICEQRFETVRRNALQWGIPGLESKPAGRPQKVSSIVDEQIAELRKRVAELEAQLQAALILAELATTLPRLQYEAGKKS